MKLLQCSVLTKNLLLIVFPSIAFLKYLVLDDGALNAFFHFKCLHATLIALLYRNNMVAQYMEDTYTYKAHVRFQAAQFLLFWAGLTKGILHKYFIPA